MTFHRAPPPPPKEDPPRVLLMRAIGDLQLMDGGEPITDFDAVVSMCGLVCVEIAALIEVGITVGYVEVDEDGAVGLSVKGQRWYERDLLRRE